MKRALALVLSCLAAPLGAHPHIFVDTGFAIVTDEAGRVTHVRVTWAYDALFSLLVTEERGLDPDGDAVLTPREEAALTGFDANWIEGYNGDLVATVGGVPVALGRPEAPTATMREGRIVTTHLRAVAGTPRLAGGEMTLKPYDPTFYTAYEVALGLTVEGLDGCEIDRVEPDLDAEMQELQSLLSELTQDQDTVEMGYPEVGENFATEVRIACAGS